jgi:SHS family lactate transporter-like MFS transporter
VLYVRSSVNESPAWVAMEKKAARPGLLVTLKRNWVLSIYAIILMTAFNFFSHGTQDLYPTFLREQHHFDPHTVSLIAIVLNVGAICGGLLFGSLSERIGRRRAICIAALIALPVLPLWAFSSTPVMLAIGAFLMQISVQGAWGVIPVHLNEISPDEIRATFPGLVYQLGNLLASVNATLQASFAVSNNNNYGLAMAVTAGTVAVIIAVLILFSRERRGIDMTKSAQEVAAATT